MDLNTLMAAVGGQSQPPGEGGPQPPEGMPYPMGQQGGNQNLLAALAGIGFMQALDSLRKYVKASNTVGMNLDKPTQVNPNSPGLGPADIQARAQRMAAQPSPYGMPQAGGQPPMPGGEAPQAGPGGMLGMLAAMRGMGGR